MEYIYGTTHISGIDRENLKTINDTHTNYEGYLTTVREYDDNTITDYCHIVSHYDSKEDEAGNCYDWYEIDQHYRTIDRTKVPNRANEKTQSLVEYVAMMSDIDIPVNLAENNVEGE